MPTHRSHHLLPVIALASLAVAMPGRCEQTAAAPEQSPSSTTIAPVSSEALEDTLGASEPAVPDPNEFEEQPAVNWVDDSHAYMTNQAQSLTEWMDEFFGDPEYNLEQAESLLRLELIDDWETEDGHDFKIRLRGKVQLPKISRRLNLVFSGEESDLDDEEDRRVDDEIGLQYEVREGSRSRLDLTMGISGSKPKPGIKYRNEGPIDDKHSYRFIERVQYSDKEKFFTITQGDLNRVIDDNNVLRWSNRAIWGERTDGVEWRTRLSLRQRLDPEARRPIALNYFAAISGETEPSSYVKNYRLGVLWRRQVYRDYLFVELEPAYNYRRKEFEEHRRSVWSMVVRLEIALQRDLIRKR